MNVKKTFKVVVVVSGVIFILIQFIQPSRTNPEFDRAKTIEAELEAPPNIRSLLERGCKDCHSNETRWPFYAYIAPVSWLVSNDVAEARKQLNFSEWGKYKTQKKTQRLSGIFQRVKDHEMPLPKYISLHPEANFSDAERDTLAQWAQREAEKMMGGE